MVAGARHCLDWARRKPSRAVSEGATSMSKVLDCWAGDARDGRQNVGAWLKSTTKVIGAWIDACADAWAAAALYDELRKLSDSELRRRGLSRASFAQDVTDSCRRTRRSIARTSGRRPASSGHADQTASIKDPYPD